MELTQNAHISIHFLISKNLANEDLIVQFNNDEYNINELPVREEIAIKRGLCEVAIFNKSRTLFTRVLYEFNDNETYDFYIDLKNGELIININEYALITKEKQEKKDNKA